MHRLVPALDAPSTDAVSFESENFPDHYLTNASYGPQGSKAGPMRLGLAARNGIIDRRLASFTIEAGLSGAPNTISVRSVGSRLYVAVASTLTGQCSHDYKAKGDGDIVLAAVGPRATMAQKIAATWILGDAYPPLEPFNATIRADLPSTHNLSPLSMGCHSDSGCVVAIGGDSCVALVIPTDVFVCIHVRTYFGWCM